jgi:adenylate cyclase class IV
MHTNCSEFEIKVELHAPDDAAELLRSLRLVKSEFVTDVYFDTVKRELFKRGVFLRLRNCSTLEVKFNPDIGDASHLSCQEHRYTLPLSACDKQGITEFLEAHIDCRHGPFESDPFALFQLEEFVRIVKERTVYCGGETEVSLDRIPGLGDFLEVEARGPTGRQSAVEFCAKNGLRNLPLGYVELWLRKHDFSTYRTGRYVLPEDRSPA